jgi:succinate dehydrogenase/fumarate reductase flavoprotein subunit
VLARGGINAALGTMDSEDNWMVHAADTLREGVFLADYERVEILCKNAPDAVNELVNWGARFHREKDGRLTQRFFGAHTYRRTVFYGDWTGNEIIRVLMDQIQQRKIEIKFLKEIQELMNQNAGIIRDETRLQHGLRRILELKKEFYSKDNILKEFKIEDDEDNSENVVLTWEVKSSLVVCEAIIRSALMRQESRGAHYRSDFPSLDNEKWNVNIYCRNEDREMVLYKQNLKEIKGPLADLLKAHNKPEHQREFE